MTEGKGLQNLVEDVLILILTHCDILSVVAIGATSKYFHHLAFTRNVWLALVKTLVQRRFIDRRPDDENLRDLSTEQLVDKVKRILRGPTTWSPTTYPRPPSRGFRPVLPRPLRKGVEWAKRLLRKSSALEPTSNPPPAPVESRRIILHPDIAIGPGILTWENEPKLLPGGKYVLFQNWGTLECWNVFEDKLVWKHACSMDHATVLVFAGELTDDDQLVILTCQRTWEDPRKNFIEFTSLDLQTGFSSLILISRFPNSQHDNPYNGCAVCGDIAAVEIGGQVTLINWRTSSYVVILTRSSRHISQIALATNCLVLTLIGPRGELQLAAVPSPRPRHGLQSTVCSSLPTASLSAISP
ncbi:hypothetical protein B0H17DRAFT_1198406 [Mycena rosella]|uniref:F-box domain-containing protein n=1 Tax=Mycena rosella TaxID=1033263 RepID=A0AAD7GIA1_MYCRO|nr:hypothetical protein B0H17DRAFT_1198406 [Mycena rosella]